MKENKFLCVIIFSFTLLLLLNGCGNSAETPDIPGISGGYVEEMLEFTGNYRRIFNFNIHSYESSFTFYAHEADGSLSRNTYENGEITVEYPETLNEIKRDVFVSSISETPDGEMLILWAEQLWTTMPQVTLITETEEEIKVLEVEVSGWLSAIDYVEALESGSGGRPLTPSYVFSLEDSFLALFMGHGIIQYDYEGREIREYPIVTGPTSIAVYENTLAIYDTDNRELVIFDTDTGQRLNRIDLAGYIQSDYYGMGDLAVSCNSQGVFVALNAGIFIIEEGNVTRLVDGEVTSLGAPSVSIAGFIPLGGEFHVIMQTANGFEFARYVYSDTALSEQAPVLEIFSLYDNPTVRQTIGAFQRQTGARVNFTIGLDGDFSPTPEDLIRVLNTRILAGTGPDIIVLDGMPLESYIKKGVLRDISGFVDNLVSSGRLMENLKTAYVRNGKVYAVPTRYSIPVMIGAPSLLAEINSLSDFAYLVLEHQSAENEFFYAPDNLYGNQSALFQSLAPSAFNNRYIERYFLMNFYDVHAKGFITDELTIDEDALESYLTNMLLIEQMLKSHRPEEYAGFRDNSIYAAHIYESVSGGIELIAKGEIQVDLFTLIGRQGLAWIFRTAGGTDDIVLAPVFNQNVYFPAGGLGILSSSGHHDLAEQFIGLALSTEVQRITLGDGFPTNQHALSYVLEDILDPARSGLPNVSDLGFSDIANSVSESVLVDLIVKTAVENHVEAVSNGDIAPAEAVIRVVNDIKLYLIE